MRLQPRGVLIAFEGIDGAGKTTQVSALEKWLGTTGLEVVRTKEPTNGTWGQIVRASSVTGRLPPEKELEVFIADRRDHVRSLLTPALERGAVILVDRYYFSTAAYQGARGLDPAEILRQNEAFAPRPDLLVILELPLDAALERIEVRGGGENLFEKREDLAKCDAIFRRLEGDDILRLDGTQPEETVAKLIADAVRALPAVGHALCSAASGAVPAATTEQTTLAEVARITNDASLSPAEKLARLRTLLV